MNKRILLSLGTLVVAGAVIAGGTGAFFSDTETSAGNVFTAGSVSIDLESITHEYYGTDPVPANYFETGTANNVPFFRFNDLKPGDTGEITSTLVNGENDALFCARTVAVTGNDSDLADLLWFRVNGGSGLPASANYAPIALDTWFSVDPADAANPGAGALAVAAGASTDLELEYCFGTFVPGTPGLAGCTVQNPGDPAVWNDAQNDAITLTTEYYAVQQRNNSGFTCGSLNEPVADPSLVVVTNDDLSTSFTEIAANPTSWFFYNDSGDTVMGQNEFAATGGTNEIVTFAGSVDGAAKMVLDDGSTLTGTYVGDPRYNIATYQFAGTLLSSVTSLKYRVYDASVSGEKPFLNFNVSFDGVDNWQRRLVHVPGASTNPTVPVNTWTEVDALDGGNAMYTWSHFVNNGNMWPDGNTNQYRSLNDLIAAFPALQIRTTDSFFGVRVGHPGPVGEENYVDSVEFNGVTYQFNN